MPHIVLENLTKKFGNVVAVNSINLTIPDKSFMCFLGPSGCGKTTTLRMIAGLEEPTSGRITIDGEIVYCSQRGIWKGPAARDIGLIFQSYAIWPHMTVYENIAFGLEMKKYSKKDIDKRIHDVTKSIKINELLARYPSELSGGQQQRVAMARSLAPEPRVLLMDEPLSNLDAKLRIEMRSELKHLHHRTNQTIVYVTHDQLEALSLGTHVAIMNEGDLQQVDNPLEIYTQPNNLFVAGFVGMPTINQLSGVIEADQKDYYCTVAQVKFTVSSNEKLTPGQKIVIGIRPEDILLHPVEYSKGLVYELYTVQPAGAESIVQLIDKQQQILTTKTDISNSLVKQDSVKITFREEHVLLFDQQDGRRIDARITIEY